MKTRASALADLTASMTPEELRREFLVADLFFPGELRLHGWDSDRTVLGAAVPLDLPLSLNNPTELRAAYFLERREAGLINLGGPGTVTVDGVIYNLGSYDALYIGRGAQTVVFASTSLTQPARFWIQSYPAHAAYPSRQVVFQEKLGERLGVHESSNERTLFKLIHPGTVQTCQLVMGFTRLEAGSVWNSMPPHTHLRRSEVYLYFNLPTSQVVFHFLGEPQATRHLVVRDSQAVLSPPWSIHCGAGTSSYSFVWCMGGENQEFADMDPAPVSSLR